MDRAELDERSLEAWSRLPSKIQAVVPVFDAWAILKLTREAHMALETNRRYRLAKLLGEGVDPVTGARVHPDALLRKRDAFKVACAKDPYFFIENCIWTQDPEGKVGFQRELPLSVFGYAKRLWIDKWLDSLNAGEGRWVHDKSRRMLMSIYRMAFELWCFRFTADSKAWVSTDKEDKLDAWFDFDSLLGKFRVMYNACLRYYPWLFPELPPHSDVNKLKYLRFPEWKQGNHEIDQRAWGNELKGVLPTDPRGGAALRGFADEAYWITEIKKLLDAAEVMTACLDFASSAPEDTANLGWKRKELKGVKSNVAPWWLNPLNIEGIHWSDVKEHPDDMYPGEWRGNHTKRWRSLWVNKEYGKLSSEEAARNIDIDPLATAGAKIFLNYDPQRVDGDKDPGSPTYDLYHPERELQVWYDPGRGDPWAFIWVQIDHKHGWVNIVDYDVGNDKTVHYFIPMLLGWPIQTMHRWRTAPEAVPWKEAVPWSYDQDRRDRMERWHSRRGHKGGRISIMNGDFYGSLHHSTDLYSVEERLQRYGLYAQSVPSNYQVNRFLEQSNEVMLRVRISGFLVDFRPEGRWPALNECFQFWRRQARQDTRGKPAEPLHDDYSHTCKAYMYGAHLLPMLVPGKVMNKQGQVERRLETPTSGRMRLQPGEGGTGWL